MMYSSLSTSGPVKWNHNQASTLFQHASPFDPAYDGRSTATLAERTRELYLQFLWLPESTMPLGQFVHMIQLLARQQSAPSLPDDVVHPLHTALDNILLTGNWCTYKYQERLLPSIVAANGSSHAHASGSSGANDLEMSIMHFVLERYAQCEDQSGESGEQQRACCSLDDQKRWLSVIEKREVQLQVLIHLLKLSLPGKCPCAPVRPVPVQPSHARKRRRTQLQTSDDGDGGGKAEAAPRDILEDRLEGLMDRLVLWQMALPDAEANADGTETVRDWTQAFCDDVVQPAFAQKLPEQYKLLRRKLFRIPQWTSSSEDEGDSDGHEAQTIRPYSPPPFPDSHVQNRHSTTRNLVPSRSRSLSASLEQEADMRRAEPRTRKVLQREVSMSKVFKGPRRNAAPAKVEAESTTTTTIAAGTSSSTAATQTQAKRPIVLVEGTPQKPKAKARSKKH